MVQRGKFIVLEGGEGAGKSTQVKHLVGALTKKGISVIHTREPGGSPVAEDIRELVVKGHVNKMSKRTELLLMYAARQDHIEKVIRPNLEAGSWVVCDRFMLSTLAYQGGMETEELMRELRWQIVEKPEMEPDYTLILDVEPAVGLARAFRRRAEDHSRFEAKDIEFHEGVRSLFRRQIAYSDFIGSMINTTEIGEEDVTKQMLWDIGRHFRLELTAR